MNWYNQIRCFTLPSMRTLDASWSYSLASSDLRNDELRHFCVSFLIFYNLPDWWKSKHELRTESKHRELGKEKNGKSQSRASIDADTRMIRMNPKSISIMTHDRCSTYPYSGHTSERQWVLFNELFLCLPSCACRSDTGVWTNENQCMRSIGKDNLNSPDGGSYPI